MYCSNCGKQIKDGSKFCNFCGATQDVEEDVVVIKKVTEGTSHKCPYCGEILPFDAIICPSCGKEIRDKGSVESVNELVEKLKLESSEERKVELIKMFPIPNSREAIFEFMIVASSNFDPKFYASNPNANSIPSAWLSQIEKCYKKGKIMFSDPRDLDKLDRLYNEVHGSEGTLTKAKKTRTLIFIAGLACIVIGAVFFVLSGMLNRSGDASTPEATSDGIYERTYSSKETAFSLISFIFIGGGIAILVVGLKKKKTEKEIAIENEQRAARDAAKREARREAIERKDRLQREAAERNRRR